MRHRKAGRKLATNSAHQRALMRNLADALIEHGRIHTTTAKAKELRSYAEKLVTLAKRGTLGSRRRIAGRVFRKESVQKLFDVYAPRFDSRQGGYTRVIHESNRAGDNANMSIIEFVDNESSQSAAETEE